MQAVHTELLSLVGSLDQGTLTWQPPDGGWSIRDNLAHLVDAERAHRRFVELVLEGRPTRIEGFDLDRWNAEHVARHAGRSVDEILADLTAERQKTLAFIAALPDDAWDKRGDHPAVGEVSVQHLARFISVHQRMHLKDIRRLLEAKETEED
jgi:uncharacterized damage-inducible protein DinB